jgi:hypothetical protein
VPLAGLAPATTARLEAVLEPGLAATNPVDAWAPATTPTASSAPAWPPWPTTPGSPRWRCAST